MIWLIGTFALGAVIWLWREGMKPAANELTHPGAIANSLRFLVTNGVYKSNIHGTMTVQLRTVASARMVFRKTRDAEGEFGVRAEFPVDASAPNHLERLREELSRKGIAFADSQAGDRGIVINIGRDFGLGLVTAQIFFQDIVGATLSRDCVAYFRDVLIKNVPRLTGVEEKNEGS